MSLKLDAFAAVEAAILVGAVDYAMDREGEKAAKSALAEGVSSLAVHEIVPMIGSVDPLINNLLTGVVYAGVQKMGFQRKGFLKNLIVGSAADYVAFWSAKSVAGALSLNLGESP